MAEIHPVNLPNPNPMQPSNVPDEQRAQQEAQWAQAAAEKEALADIMAVFNKHQDVIKRWLSGQGKVPGV